MPMHRSNEPATPWGPIAAGLLLVAFLVLPIVVVATMANPASKTRSDIETAPAPEEPVLTYRTPILSGNPGHFAHGYLEFDADPSAPGGVPGFDSWPPGSPRR